MPRRTSPRDAASGNQARSTRHNSAKLVSGPPPRSTERTIKVPKDKRQRAERIPAPRFRDQLMTWYREHARSLPWRGIHDPYATWLSEIMLQQTRVATVIDRYIEFLRRFPTLQALAAASEDEVLALWSGLGYYRRARMLHRGAQFVVRELDGKLPRTSTELRTLPGVGEYTAAAVASIAFGESIAVVDGNVERVLLRILGQPEDRSAAGRAIVLSAAQSLVPPAWLPSGESFGDEVPQAANPPGDHNQAMMELGATICLPREPLCLHCPVVALCRTRGEHPTQPRGQHQSRVVAHLLTVRKHGRTTEVLLERRPDEASLMPGMLELPPLPMAAVEGREPVLRVRHAITNTNYVVEIFSESAPGPQTDFHHLGEQSNPRQPGAHLPRSGETVSANLDGDVLATPFVWATEDAVFEAGEESSDATASATQTLLSQIPAARNDLIWTPIHGLRELPLTGLARKCLQRLRLMQPDIRPRR